MKQLGPTFGAELVAAGLAGLPIDWGDSDAGIAGRQLLTAEQNAALDAVIAAHDPARAARRLVPKSLVIERLHQAGLLAAARAALDADVYARERWYAPDKPAIQSDDPEALALLAAIGADPAAILAP
jgi:hypothetical protein